MDLYFYRGPDDDSNGIETCRPKSIDNIPYGCCFWLNIVLYYIYIYIEHFGMENIKYSILLASIKNCRKFSAHADTAHKQ